MVTVVLPFPVPFAGVAPRPEALHAQPEPEAVIPMSAVPPAEPAVRFAGLIANEQPEPNCVIV
jgi:hypothetical protein